MQFIFHRSHSACSIVDNTIILTRFGAKMGMRFHWVRHAMMRRESIKSSVHRPDTNTVQESNYDNIATLVTRFCL